MKKILFMEAYCGVCYGAQKSMFQLIKVLENKAKCTVLTTKKDELFFELKKQKIDSKVIELGEIANVFGGKALKYGVFKKIKAFLEILDFQFKVLKYIKAENISIIYSNDPRSYFMIFLVAKFLRMETITYIRADLKNNWISRFCIKNCNSIITIADGLLKELPENLITENRNKIKTIYTGFEFEEYDYDCKLTEINKNKVIIGYVASLGPRKGLDFLVDILLADEELKKKTQLVIVGSILRTHIVFWEDLKKKMDSERLDYKFLGYQSNVHRAYNSIDVLALPSLSEGLPRVVIEAMAHGVSVIANNVGGTNQIIEHGVNGFIEEPLDKENWGKDILELINNKQLREKMGTYGYKLVREKFSIEKFEKEINNEF